MRYMAFKDELFSKLLKTSKKVSTKKLKYRKLLILTAPLSNAYTMYAYSVHACKIACCLSQGFTVLDGNDVQKF